MLKRTVHELRVHAPFTAFGAILGVILMVFFHKIPYHIAQNVFYVFHPLHVVLSALVTASIYQIHKCAAVKGECKINIWVLLAIGYVGSIGIATLSDSLIPYLGEVLLKMPRRKIHLGFIEKWWLVNPLAVIGVALAYFRPTTKFPHSGHVLLSTWASLFHVLMAVSGTLNWFSCLIIFVFLFISVWVPCCISDIVFPLLFVKNNSGNK